MYVMRRNYLVCLLILLVGCTSNKDTFKTPVFRDEIESDFSIISDDLGFNSINDLFIYKGYAIVYAYDFDSGEWLHVYDKATGEHIVSAVTYGRGPGELNSSALNAVMSYDDGILVLNDAVQNKRIVYDIERLVANGIEGSFYEDEYLYETWLTHVFKTENNRSLKVCNQSPEALEETNGPRFSIVNGNDEVVSTYEKFPLEDNTRARWNLYAQPSISLSPNGERFAVGTSFGAILETFRISHDTIYDTSISYFIDPCLNENVDNYFLESTLGFGDIFTTDEYVYTVYDGETKFRSDNFNDILSSIAVFNWNGVPLMRIQCGGTIEQIFVNSSERLLYAIVKESDGSCHLAKMSVPDDF